MRNKTATMAGTSKLPFVLWMPGVYPESVGAVPGSAIANPPPIRRDQIMQNIMQTGSAVCATRSEHSVNTVEAFDRVPAFFSDAKSHPKMQHVECWMCGDDRLVDFGWFVPHSEPQHRHTQNQGNVKIKWRIEGHFCATPCVKRYIDKKYTENNSVYSGLVGNLRMLIAEVSGLAATDIKHIWAANNHRKQLQSYGVGNMTRQAYRLKLEELEQLTFG